MNQNQRPSKVEHGGEVHPDNERKGSNADKVRHEDGIPDKDELHEIKGTDTPATTPAERQRDADRTTL